MKTLGVAQSGATLMLWCSPNRTLRFPLSPMTTQHRKPSHAAKIKELRSKISWMHDDNVDYGTAIYGGHVFFFATPRVESSKCDLRQHCGFRSSLCIGLTHVFWASFIAKHLHCLIKLVAVQLVTLSSCEKYWLSVETCCSSPPTKKIFY